MTDLSSGTRQLLSIAKGREDIDPGETAEWLEALEVALHSLTTPLDGTILASADRAIGTIREALTAQKDA